jgi:hypothetical protein
MMFTFAADGEVLVLTKLPRQNLIQARIAGKTILYERKDQEVIKITDVTDSHEPGIVALIKQYFVPDERYNRRKAV